MSNAELCHEITGCFDKRLIALISFQRFYFLHSICLSELTCWPGTRSRQPQYRYSRNYFLLLPLKEPLSRKRLHHATMGNTKSGAMSKEILDELKMNTKFSEMELVQWYENFKRQCPTERITKEEFQEIYSKFFPDSDAQTYSQHVFRSFDTNADGTLDFKEYIIALHMTSTGKTTTMKLEWAFGLFDVDKNGYITKSEVKEICTVSSGELQREV